MIRSALSPIFARLVSRAPTLEISVAAIRGKTGPVPNGAVLFGPFSWAYKKKDEEKTKAKERGNVCVCPERGSSKGCPAIRIRNKMQSVTRKRITQRSFSRGSAFPHRPPCRTAPFFLVLFLGRTRKRTKKKQKLKREEMSVSARNAVPARVVQPLEYVTRCNP